VKINLLFYFKGNAIELWILQHKVKINIYFQKKLGRFSAYKNTNF